MFDSEYEVIKDQPGDSYYVRAMFDRVPETLDSSQLTFQVSASLNLLRHWRCVSTTSITLKYYNFKWQTLEFIWVKN